MKPLQRVFAVLGVLVVSVSAVVLWAQGQPVMITNIQATDWVVNTAINMMTHTGPLALCRTSAARPTAAAGDTYTFPWWCNLYGAVHTVPTDNGGNDLSAATNYYLLSTASTNAANVKNAAGSLHLVHLSNPTGTAGYLKLYNTAAAPSPCSSTTGYVESIWVGAGAVNGRSFPIGATYGTGLSICFVASGANNSNDTAVAGVEIYLQFR